MTDDFGSNERIALEPRSIGDGGMAEIPRAGVGTTVFAAHGFARRSRA
jgi:hypothetical protein